MIPGKRFRRRQLIVFPKIQWALLAVVPVVAALGCVIAFPLARLMVSDEISNSNRNLVMLGLLLATLMSSWMVLGIYFTNRIFGPIFRLQRELKALRRGEKASPIRLRKSDHFTELIEDFNHLAARLESPMDHRE